MEKWSNVWLPRVSTTIFAELFPLWSRSSNGRTHPRARAQHEKYQKVDVAISKRTHKALSCVYRGDKTRKHLEGMYHLSFPGDLVNKTVLCEFPPKTNKAPEMFWCFVSAASNSQQKSIISLQIHTTRTCTYRCIYLYLTYLHYVYRYGSIVYIYIYMVDFRCFHWEFPFPHLPISPFPHLRVRKFERPGSEGNSPGFSCRNITHMSKVFYWAISTQLHAFSMDQKFHPQKIKTYVFLVEIPMSNRWNFMTT